MPANIAYSPTLGRHQAMYADKPAWHGLGQVVAGAQTPEAAMTAAGTDFVVATSPLYVNIVGDHTDGLGDWQQIDSHQATYRTDTNDILGVVSKDYEPIQNITPMQMLGEIVRTKEAGIVAHAALGKGERLFAVLELARLKDLKIRFDPSPTDAYLVAQWWHDGTGALTIGESLVRVECQNMANAQLAYAESKGRLARIVHRGDTVNAVEEARRILGYAERHVDGYLHLMEQLMEIVIQKPRTWIDDFTEKLIPIPETMERPGSRQETRDIIHHLFMESKTLVGVPTSPYRAFQAVTEYADHYRPLRVSNPSRVPARRFTTSIDGPAAELKRQAMTLLREEFEIR